MTKLLFSAILAFHFLSATPQNKMRPIEELINTTDPGWKLVNEWIHVAKNKVEILPVDTLLANDALYKIQVTTRSPMGAIVFMTGGLMIDYGWIRILGSGNAKLHRTLPDWNKGKSFNQFGESASFLLIADDVVGGFYLLNGGGLGKDLGKVYYFSPANLKYEPLNMTYTEFLLFCFNGDLNMFYKNYRWPNWQNEVISMDGDNVFNFYPPLWAKEGKTSLKMPESQCQLKNSLVTT